MDESSSAEHSIAVLLVGMSMIDGEVDAQEMRALVDVLRGFPGVEASTAAQLGQRAFRQLWELVEQEGDLVATLREHAGLLALAYDTPLLQSLHERLSDMAQADGEVHPMEARLLHAFRYAWELGSAPS